jgi:predicted esterase
MGPTNGVIHITHVDPHGNIAYAHFSSLTRPPELAEINLATGNWNTLYTCPRAEDCRCPNPQFITIQSTKSPGVPAFYWPATQIQNIDPSVLIVVHGGSNTLTYPTWEGYIRSVTELGCSVIAENHRGSSGYGQAYENLAGDPVEDVRATLNYAIKTLKIKPQRIFLIGVSTGSRLIASTVAKGDEIGGLFLVSWPGGSAPSKPIFQKNLPVFEFHGGVDAVLSPSKAHASLEQFFKGSEYELQYDVFDAEGHFFYDIESTATIYWKLRQLINSR